MVVIRLARGGRVHRPVYNIVAADSRNKRDGRFLEKLGQYDPHKENVLDAVNVEAISAWVKKGAQLSSTVKSLLKKNKLALS